MVTFSDSGESQFSADGSVLLQHLQTVLKDGYDAHNLLIKFAKQK
jgi:hypothetical protein